MIWVSAAACAVAAPVEAPAAAAAVLLVACAVAAPVELAGADSVTCVVACVVAAPVDTPAVVMRVCDVACAVALPVLAPAPTPVATVSDERILPLTMKPFGVGCSTALAGSSKVPVACVVAAPPDTPAALRMMVPVAAAVAVPADAPAEAYDGDSTDRVLPLTAKPFGVGCCVSLAAVGTTPTSASSRDMR